jgi:intracellular sulfur oxidation DsrE/DsrF family protein
MKQLLLPTLIALALAGCASMAAPEAPRAQGATPAMSPDNRAALAGVREMKMAFDVTDANPQALLLKLDTIDLTRKQLIEAGVTPKIVVAFRGNASFYTQSDLGKIKEADRADALRIRARLRELSKASGVEAIEQCNVPLEPRKIKPADVMQEVKVVGNGWISLAAYQQRGYSYIAP